MHKDDTICLRHMLDAARQAVQFAQGRRPADLDSDPMLMLSLVKLVEIVGEAASFSIGPDQGIVLSFNIINLQT